MSSKHPMDFTRKVIAVSGAASGMGLATAQYVYGLGASVSITDVRREALEEAVKTISGAEFVKYKQDSSRAFEATHAIQGASDGAVAIKSDDPVIETGNPRIFAIATDVRSSEQVDRWIEGTVQKLGGLHGCANMAGVVGRLHGKGTILDITDKDWDFMTGINLSGVFFALRAQIGAMKKLIESGKQTGGAIVNAASTAGVVGFGLNSDYGAAKHGVVGLTRCMSKEWGHLNIRTNCVCPGIIATPMVQTLSEEAQASVDFLLEKLQPLHRRAEPIEVGRVIAFLMSDESSFITGAVHVVDGGQTC